MKNVVHFKFPLKVKTAHEKFKIPQKSRQPFGFYIRIMQRFQIKRNLVKRSNFGLYTDIFLVVQFETPSMCRHNLMLNKARKTETGRLPMKVHRSIGDLFDLGCQCDLHMIELLGTACLVLYTYLATIGSLIASLFAVTFLFMCCWDLLGITLLPVRGAVVYCTMIL